MPRPRCAGWAPGAPGARARPRRPPAPRAPSWARLGALRKQRGSGHSLHRQTLHALLCFHVWALGKFFARKIQLWNYGHYLLISHKYHGLAKIRSGNGFRGNYQRSRAVSPLTLTETSPRVNPSDGCPEAPVPHPMPHLHNIPFFQQLLLQDCELTYCANIQTAFNILKLCTTLLQIPNQRQYSYRTSPKDCIRTS